MRLKGRVSRRKLRRKYYSKLRERWMTCDYITTEIHIHVPKKLERKFKNKEVEVIIKNKIVS